jgi:integrase
MRDSRAAVTAHLEWMRQRGLSPTTIVYRRRLLTRLAGELPKPILAATPRDLARWRGGLTLSPATVLHYVSHAASFYNWAVAARLITVNPAAGLPVPKAPHAIPRPIAEDDLMLAVQSAPSRIRPWLILAGWCGLRAQEIARLRGEDIHTHTTPPVLVVTVHAAKGNRERTVPLSAFVLAELAAARVPSRGWAFTRLDDRPGPNAAWVVSQLSSAHLHACGIPASLHQLRHRFGTSLYQQTHDLRLVQEMLGHADPATTAGYAAWDRSGAMAAVEALAVPAHLWRVG